MKAKQYHTVGTAPKYNRNAKNTTLSEQFQNLTEKQKNTIVWIIPKSNRKTKKYHNVWTVLKSNRKTKNTTMSEQF